MARLLGVSRNTVMNAYDELVAAGLIQGRRGAGMLVTAGRSGGMPATPKPTGQGGPAFDLQQVLRQAQYPSRTLRVLGPDGNDLYLTVP